MTSADIVNTNSNSKHILTWVRWRGGGTLIISYISRLGPFFGVIIFCVFVMTPKDIHKIFIFPKIFIFLKTQKILKFKILNPKNGPSLRMNGNIRVPLSLSLSLSQHMWPLHARLQKVLTEGVQP